MKYRKPGLDFWDAWFLQRDGEVHAFHMQVPDGTVSFSEEEGRSVGHLTSKDLLHWTFRGNVLEPLMDPDRPQDFHQKFTGCAFCKDGVTYLYYTMRDRESCSQRIGLATSGNGFDFKLYPGNPVIEPDPSVLIGFANRDTFQFDPVVDCRDLIVVKDPDSPYYYGYFAAGADVGRVSPVGVIAVCRSTDLIHWTDQAIAYVPPVNGVIEVPDVYRIGDKWYLTVLCGANYTGRSAIPDDYVTNATLYAVADSPTGPFVHTDDCLFLGGTIGSGFTCRTVEWEGKRYVLYVDRASGGNSLALPKEVRLVDGCLRPVYTDRLASLRTGERTVLGVTPHQNAFAWNSVGGWQEKSGDGISLRTEGRSAHFTELSLSGSPDGSGNCEILCTMSPNAKASGIVFYMDGQPYTVSLEPSRKRILLLKTYTMDFVAGRELKDEGQSAYELRVLVVDGVLEAYLDGVLLLQAAVPKTSDVRPGLFCEDGSCTFRNVHVYSLEA